MRRSLQTLLALVFASLWAGGLGMMHVRGDATFLDRVEGTLTDVRILMRGERAAPDLVTIVAIDDDTARDHGGFPMARATLAQLIHAIARLEPKVVAVDLLLVDPKSDDGDQALAEALGSVSSVIGAAAIFADGTQRISSDAALGGIPTADRFLQPLKRFADKAAAVGIVNVSTDTAGTPRFVPLLFRSDDQIEMSFSLAVAALATGADPSVTRGSVILAGRTVRTDLGYALPLGFYGPRGTVRTISAAKILNGEVVAEDLRNRVVVIGATVTGGGDVFHTPFDSVLPGVEVISTAVLHLLAGDGPVRDRGVRVVDAGIAVVLVVLLIGLLAWRRNVIGLVVIAGVIIAWAGSNMLAFAHGVWLSAALPLVAAVPPAILFGAFQLFHGRRRAQYFAMKSDLLQQFQAPGLRDWIIPHPEFLLTPVRQDAAVVFIDLSRFTALSETLGPDSIRNLLKGFHALVDEEVVACGGVITSFMGDGAMILFGLPQPRKEDAAHAARCCVGLSDRMQRWLPSLPAPIAKQIGFKIGAHAGTIVASRLGGGSYQHITATGDTVNVASRLMEVAASHNAEIAVSEDLLQAAGPDCALFQSGLLEPPVEATIRGRSGALTVRLWRNRGM